MWFSNFHKSAKFDNDVSAPLPSGQYNNASRKMMAKYNMNAVRIYHKVTMIFSSFPVVL